ncbi:unnamed protein product [Spirodela intermedia]|uniref:Uncharacterized protein n=1 Tax=Spirodela intermedia TaxID=51605 RepID=A0A7I8IPI2_SPIIN|nr:unnamed protein product [Spirodela intermedia]CAA6659789.1 unnamed protein product [Spirodela intermedia]
MAQCPVCQQNKNDSLSLVGLLQPLPITVRIWADITLKFIEGLPRSNNFNAILVVVDRLKIIRLHGFPESIISDKDQIFMSFFWRELFKLSGTSLRRTSSYHSQVDGYMARALVQYQIQHLYRDISIQNRVWTQPPALLQYKSGEAVMADLNQLLQEQDEALEQLKQHLAQAPAPFLCPFKFLERIDAVTYRLELPPKKAAILPVFHPISPLRLNEELSWTVEPTEVLEGAPSVTGPEVLISWKELHPSEAMWKKTRSLRHQFLEFDLDDKVNAFGGVLSWL